MNKKMKKLYFRVIIIISLTIFLSCTNNPFSVTTKISDILASPSKYSDTLICVKGRVTESLVFFGQGYFVIADGTGVIAVVPSKTYPKTGEDVTIKGHVKNAFVIGNESLTVVIEDTQ